MKRIIAGFAILGVYGGCSATGAGERPGVEQVSSSVVRYVGHEIGAFVSSRYAGSQLGDEWMILMVSLTGEGENPVRVERSAISLRGPEGNIFVLPSQRGFRESFGELQPLLRHAQIASPPPGNFPGFRTPCERWFFAATGDGLGFDYLDLTPHRVCSGPLVFLVPGGVQPGRWVLQIDLEESDVRIPFVLPAS
jgi:hypothetical protein